MTSKTNAQKIQDWRDAPSLGGNYRVSSDGQIWSRPRKGTAGGVLSPHLSRKGYLQINLAGKTRKVHRLVCEAFHGPPERGQLVRHLNGIKTDNRAENLAWGSASQNMLDCVSHGTHVWANRTECPRGHEYLPDNTYASPKGKRHCRECHRESGRRRRSQTYYHDKLVAVQEKWGNDND